jgi:imidazolonepropionase-like amidohydrolase
MTASLLVYPSGPADPMAGLGQEELFQFTDDEIRSIIETAHRLGRRVAAHVEQIGLGRGVRWKLTRDAH